MINSNNNSESLNKKHTTLFADEGWTDRDHYFKVKKMKLDEQWKGQQASSSANSTLSSSTSELSSSNNTTKSSAKAFFEGLIMNIDGYTEPSNVVLVGLITKHGGSYRQFFDSSVTHLLACELAHSRLKELTKRKHPPIIVHPRWIMDCVKAECLLSVKDYLIVDHTRNTIQHKDLRSFTMVNRAHHSTTVGKHQQPQMISHTNVSTDKEITNSIPESRKFLATHEGVSNSPAPSIQEFSHANQFNFALTPTSSRSTVKFKKKTQTLQTTLPNPQPLPSISQVQQKQQPGIQPPPLPPPKPSYQKFIPPSRPTVTTTENPLQESIIANNKNVSNNLEIMSKDEKPVNKEFLTKSAANDPNFIDHYMKNSRLHFISTWRNKKKQTNPSGSIAEKKGLYVVHIDMDCFFASIAMRDNPSLRDKPIAVSYSNDGNSDISSANYCAREFGVRAGMWSKQARELCPELIVVPYEFEKYEEAACKVHGILNNHCERVKIMSIDEAYIEISNELQNGTQEELEKLVSSIRSEIEKETGCTASAGMSTNQLLARMATKVAKPNGQYFLHPNDAVKHIEKLNIEDIPTVGWKTKRFFNEMNVFSCAQLLKYSLTEMKGLIGEKKGETLFNYLRGIDRRGFFDDSARKSVGVEVNYGIRFSELKQVYEFIDKLSVEISNRLKSEQIKGKAIVLKVKKRREGIIESKKFLGHGICDNFSKSTTVPYFTDDVDMISRKVKDLYKQLEIEPEDLRGIAIQIQKLNNYQPTKDGSSTLTKYLNQAQTETIEAPQNVPPEFNNQNEQQYHDSKDDIEKKKSKNSKKIKHDTTNAHAFRMDEYCELDNIAKGGYDQPISFSFIEEMPWDIKREIIHDLTKQKREKEKQEARQKQLAEQIEAAKREHAPITVSEESQMALFSTQSIDDISLLQDTIFNWFHENQDDFYTDAHVANLFVELVMQILNQLANDMNLLAAKRIVKFVRKLLVDSQENLDVVDEQRLEMARSVTETINLAFQKEIVVKQFTDCMVPTF
ncbi:hypothetical protein C9374_008187 [Naegleria lovaniensis]|uniref:DNA repair protein REV1 n=1 Tax=Naegleria lovaniensis TaxID=51637 RepID=A0AA88GLT5_NAELO|nr:uncharacterized protein C9374_008187 [Naegleria lovaniensis]KAG2378548.1 hypothetical protein C9374_008187 [Naegleria lovaniensis]